MELSGDNFSQMVLDVFDYMLKDIGTTTTNNLRTLFSYRISIVMFCSETELMVTSVENYILKYNELKMLFTAVSMVSKLLQSSSPHYEHSLLSTICCPYPQLYEHNPSVDFTYSYRHYSTHYLKNMSP